MIEQQKFNPSMNLCVWTVLNEILKEKKLIFLIFSFCWNVFLYFGAFNSNYFFIIRIQQQQQRTYGNALRNSNQSIRFALNCCVLRVLLKQFSNFFDIVCEKIFEINVFLYQNFIFFLSYQCRLWILFIRLPALFIWSWCMFSK